MNNNTAETQFSCFREELDTRYDLHEKVVKISRDITIESKRLIFLLHRIVSGKDKNTTLQQAKEKHAAIIKNLERIAQLLNNVDAFQFLRGFSSGLQEFIEATALLVFIEKHNEVDIADISSCIVSKQHINSYLTFVDETDESQSVSIPFPMEDYLLGLADVTGEMMRLCINSSGDALGKQDWSNSLSFKLCSYIQALHSSFSIFVELVDVSPGLRKQFDDKMRTMNTNVRKCEDVCYALKIRGHEMPKDLLKASLMDTKE